MLSDKKRKKLLEVFKTLSELDKKLIALKAICFQHSAGYGGDKKIIEAVVKSKITDATGNLLTASQCQKHIDRLKHLGFSEQKSMLIIPEALHHELLLLMSASQMTWVFTMVDTMCGRNIPDFADLHHQRGYHYEDSFKIRACLMKAIYANETEYFLAHQNNPIYCNKIINYLDDIIRHCPMNIEWLASREKIIQFFICITLLSQYHCEAPPRHNSKEVLALFSQKDFTNIEHDVLHYYTAIIYLFLGNIKKAALHADCIKEQKSGVYLAIKASIALLTGQFDVARVFYQKALPALRKQYGSRSYYFDNFLGVLHGFCVIYVEKNLLQLDTHMDQFAKYSENHQIFPMSVIYSFLPMMITLEQGNQNAVNQALRDINKLLEDRIFHPLAVAVYYLLGYMVNKNFLQQNLDKIVTQAQQCIQSNHLLAAQILYELLANTTEYEQEANVFLDQSEIKLRVLNLINVKDAWEYSFQALEGLLLEGVDTLTATRAKRLLWLIDPVKQTVGVVEQQVNKSGTWTPGKDVSLKKLKCYNQHEQFDYLSMDDKRVIECLAYDSNNWHSDYYSFDIYRAFLALVGHRHIAHLQNREVMIELVQGEPELYIEENKSGYHLSLSHWLPRPGLIIQPESLNKYRVIEFSNAFANIGQVLTKNGLSIPVIAKDKILRVIQNAKRDIKIHVGITDIGIPEINGDPTPCIQLLPTKEGLKASLWVRPFINGNYCKIGQGKEHIMTLFTENGHETRTRIVRDLVCEKNHLTELLTQCPSLTQHESDLGEYEMISPEETLEVLSELQEYAKRYPLMIEWPQGQTFKIRQRVFADNLFLKITSNTNWFEYSGEITLNDGAVLSMQTLLESLSTSYGRFIRLNNGEFIELTSKLKKQLSLLHALSDGNRINPLGAQILSDIAAEAENTTFDKGWEAHLEKLQTMKSHMPKVPSTLQASLRDYQIEGFHYLSRLTHWGIGACLADDMGLGKTIQSIALLLERAMNGPSLIITPTSIGFNWIEELTKFAPTLKVYNLRTDDRANLIDKADKFDVIICSYGLLHHNDELLTGKQWETIILDEAQAIKNANTQRWKTVMKLKGKNRIALSGTPIENHLGELWSIFSFINPGLLGTIKSFQSKYLNPIETSQAPDRVQALKALVSPYILRRIKSEVLSELPPKTEQTIYVAQTQEEAAFYEALRRQAEKQISVLMEENNRIGVLAEITKLRQACCDSSLVDKSLAIENSKLNAFIETVKNIIENGHKALVFSQYVSFLQIVKKRIEHEKIVYQYLDGSTSPANRKKSVDLFQSGEGDLFLLSLKAGGSGLNLTAADYVIHLDPWWNPAVEDQASDRAHRIGQERPVTIYRFIMQNTIEEKMIALHQKKRNLANELLSGQGVSGKLSNDDLMDLIVGSGREEAQAYVRGMSVET